MSRIGTQPIKILSGVQVKIEKDLITVVGPKGSLNLPIHPEIKVEVVGDQIKIARRSEEKKAMALHGLTRTLIANMVLGVTSGWYKTLELVGVGYRAAREDKGLVLNLGFSHPVKVASPPGIELNVEGAKIIVSGIDKAQVGQVAASIRRFKPPEPYKGKGIRYQGEIVRRKPGKAAKVGATLPAGGSK